MTPDDLAAIKARADAATGGIWTALVDGTPEGDIVWIRAAQIRPLSYDFIDVACITQPSAPREGDTDADADFIAHAREDVPALLAEVEGWRQAAETYKASRDASDQRADEARAEVERLRAANLERTADLAECHRRGQENIALNGHYLRLLDEARAEVERLRAVVASVEALHQPTQVWLRSTPEASTACDLCQDSWPCLTAAALTAAQDAPAPTPHTTTED